MVTFTLPTSRPVTQDWAQEFYNFNGTLYPNGFYRSLGWNGHNGIDYGCFEGDPVEAVCDGVIEYVGPGNNHPLLTGGGNTILLRNDELGMRFEYLHLSQQNVFAGQRVKVGQVIGLSGATGAATAPHLHLGAIPVGNVDQNDGWRGRVDPTPYLYGPMNPEFAVPGAIIPQDAPASTYTPDQQFFIDLSLPLP
ncbi:M23 family metallopeptidase [Arthrobacter sp. KNU-44]|uniref:M23 family metallopeptidase n=1 Tax=Arthrobacter sp. KNU-44 TaxID=3450744 RepID=UPI003F43860B